MLILQPFPGQPIWIGTDIKVVVLGHFNGFTHIGIEASHEFKIIKEELQSREPFYGYE
jgi:sRNA-binding carbon storage regulator CsrA